MPDPIVIASAGVSLNDIAKRYNVPLDRVYDENPQFKRRTVDGKFNLALEEQKIASGKSGRDADYIAVGESINLPDEAARIEPTVFYKAPISENRRLKIVENVRNQFEAQGRQVGDKLTQAEFVTAAMKIDPKLSSAQADELFREVGDRQHKYTDYAGTVGMIELTSEVATIRTDKLVRQANADIKELKKMEVQIDRSIKALTKAQAELKQRDLTLDATLAKLAPYKQEIANNNDWNVRNGAINDDGTLKPWARTGQDQFKTSQDRFRWAEKAIAAGVPPTEVFENRAQAEAYNAEQKLKDMKSQHDGWVGTIADGFVEFTGLGTSTFDATESVNNTTRIAFGRSDNDPSAIPALQARLDKLTQDNKNLFVRMRSSASAADVQNMNMEVSRNTAEIFKISKKIEELRVFNDPTYMVSVDETIDNANKSVGNAEIGVKIVAGVTVTALTGGAGSGLVTNMLVNGGTNVAVNGTDALTSTGKTYSLKEGAKDFTIGAGAGIIANGLVKGVPAYIAAKQSAQIATKKASEEAAEAFANRMPEEIEKAVFKSSAEKSTVEVYAGKTSKDVLEEATQKSAKDAVDTAAKKAADKAAEEAIFASTFSKIWNNFPRPGGAVIGGTKLALEKVVKPGVNYVTKAAANTEKSWTGTGWATWESVATKGNAFIKPGVDDVLNTASKISNSSVGRAIADSDLVGIGQIAARDARNLYEFVGPGVRWATGKALKATEAVSGVADRGAGLYMMAAGADAAMNGVDEVPNSEFMRRQMNTKKTSTNTAYFTKNVPFGFAVNVDKSGVIFRKPWNPADPTNFEGISPFRIDNDTKNDSYRFISTAGWNYFEAGMGVVIGGPEMNVSASVGVTPLKLSVNPLGLNFQGDKKPAGMKDFNFRTMVSPTAPYMSASFKINIGAVSFSERIAGSDPGLTISNDATQAKGANLYKGESLIWAMGGGYFSTPKFNIGPNMGYRSEEARPLSEWYKNAFEPQPRTTYVPSGSAEDIAQKVAKKAENPVFVPSKATVPTVEIGKDVKFNTETEQVERPRSISVSGGLKTLRGVMDVQLVGGFSQANVRRLLADNFGNPSSVFASYPAFRADDANTKVEVKSVKATDGRMVSAARVTYPEGKYADILLDKPFEHGGYLVLFNAVQSKRQ